MSAQSAFEKRYVDPKDQSDVEGLLELFNLPPKFIAFLRKNKRAVQATVAVILITVVTVSLYGSYKERKIENAASALTLAIQETGTAQKEALQAVVDTYKGTPSAAWAQVELAHFAMKDRDFASAAKQYSTIHGGITAENPLYALSLYGIAQAEETQGNSDAAYGAYERLKDIAGYQLTGYTGMARILEAKGENEKALGIYGQYLAVIGDSAEAAGQKALIEARIARIKARQ
jgi:tetratricopeptide (TPR) repeat protein